MGLGTREGTSAPALARLTVDSPPHTGYKRPRYLADIFDLAASLFPGSHF